MIEINQYNLTTPTFLNCMYGGFVILEENNLIKVLQMTLCGGDFTVSNPTMFVSSSSKVYLIAYIYMPNSHIHLSLNVSTTECIGVFIKPLQNIPMSARQPVNFKYGYETALVTPGINTYIAISFPLLTCIDVQLCSLDVQNIKYKDEDWLYQDVYIHAIHYDSAYSVEFLIQMSDMFQNPFKVSSNLGVMDKTTFWSGSKWKAGNEITLHMSYDISLGIHISHITCIHMCRYNGTEIIGKCDLCNYHFHDLDINHKYVKILTFAGNTTIRTFGRQCLNASHEIKV